MISSQTLHDLDILAYSNKQGSLFDELNHCQTKGGASVLREYFKLRDSSKETIMQRQEAVRYLVNSKYTLLPISDNDIYYSEQYLDSSFGIIRSNSKWMRTLLSQHTTFFRSYRYHFILSGVRQLLTVIGHIRQLYSYFQSPAPPQLLKEIFDNIKARLLSLGIDEQQHNQVTLDSPSVALLFSTDERLRVTAKEDVIALLQLYYQLDASMSLALAHQNKHLSFPAFTDGTMQLSGLYHPLVKGCVPNTVSFSRHTNLLIITGPNMAGKSTLMKSIGLACYMAYLGIGVAADSAELPIIDEIVTSINIEDNITAGYSYFFSEVQNIKNITGLLASGRKLLVIADELFKGTNVKDAFDCCKVVLVHFMQQPGSLFVFSTHLADLVEDLAANGQCDLRYVEAAVSDGNIIFDYRLKEGVNQQRLGVNILQQQIPQLFA